MTNQQLIKIVLLLLFPFFLWSQTSYKISKNDSYEDIKKLFYAHENNKGKQLIYANAYLQKAKKEGNAIEKARGWYLIASKYSGIRAIQYLDSAIVVSKNRNDPKYPAYAYSEKAIQLRNLFRFREALDNFILAEKESQINNVFFYYYAKLSIAILRSEELGEVKEALVLYKECFNYYKQKDVRDPEYARVYQAVIFALADAHKALSQSDSATYYNKLGFKESEITKEKENNGLFTLNEGANLVLKKNYAGALDSLKKALPVMITFKNKENTLAAYYYFGLVYASSGKHEKAKLNFIKVDSLYGKTKKITPEFISGYKYLISYYKKRNDKENQLKYINKLMSIDSTFQKNYRELSKKLQLEYDTPHLIAEKEALIQSLEKGQSVSYIWIVVLVVGVAGLIGYQFYLKKLYQKRFEEIINPTLVDLQAPNAIKTEDDFNQENKPQESLGIATEVVEQLLDKLAGFESNEGYLEHTITIQKVALQLNTNTKYLSKVINDQKGKTFVHYINDLRITHAVDHLQAQPKLRNYTMLSLAKEFGFNSAEAFAAAFYKKHKIKPTFFIKSLENEK
nr:helix-turn-helix domain-containing protein [Flavobacterium sp.]